VERVLVVGDSLAFHGPEHGELLTHPGLYPNVLARLLGCEVDVVARLGWTARDAWWALTRDPYVYSVLLPRADAVVLAVGGADHLPAALPVYLKNGLDYVRPGWLRRRAKLALHHATPYVVRATGGRLRTLPQQATLHYLTRCVDAIRATHPGTRVVGIVPPPFDAWYFGNVTSTHAPAAAAHRAWGERTRTPLADLDAVIAPHLAAGTLNPDGMHWSWAAHEDVAKALAQAITTGATYPGSGGRP
jgi:lysophospholipase L1-like esterase